MRSSQPENRSPGVFGADRTAFTNKVMGVDKREPIVVDLGSGVTMIFLPIPAGRFRMGQRGKHADEEPVTEVSVGALWMGETPVTKAQYRVLAEGCLRELAEIEGNEGAASSGAEEADRPVGNVNWHEARVIASALERRMRSRGELPEGYRVDLPSEAQWEYACRAGTETDYWSGDGEAALAEVGWYFGNSGRETHRVGEKRCPNPWGLHDMHGNVWEWCRDPWDPGAGRLRVPGNRSPEFEEAEEASGVHDSKARVLRGGSWVLTAGGCRSACRVRGRPGDRAGARGFRLAVVPGPSSQGGEAGGRKGAEPGAGGKPRRDDESGPEGMGGATVPPGSGGDFF